MMERINCLNCKYYKYWEEVGYEKGLFSRGFAYKLITF